MLPAYTKVNQAKLIFIFTSRRYAVLKYYVLCANELKLTNLPLFDITNNC